PLSPPGYVGLYTYSFSLANIKLPLTEFFCELMVVSPLSTSSEGSLISVKLVGTNGFSMFKTPSSLPKMAFRNFIYTEDDEDLTFFPKEPSSGFEVTMDFGGSTKPELFVVHPGSVADRIKYRKCKTKGSSRPHVKRKLASGFSTSRATRAKTSSSKDNAPFLTVFDDDEDANACHLKISDITHPAWKNHLDNHIDLELLDLHDRCYNPAVVALREKISALSTEAKEHKLSLDTMMLESQK
nr:hypothetical protein [Tanacetum cinerariifolium]